MTEVPTGDLLHEVRSVAAARWGLSARHLRERDLRVAAAALGLEGAGSSRTPADDDAAIGALTVGETYFFRDPAQLRILQEDLLPDIAAKVGGIRPLRIWSAGCSTGEEAWTLAMVVERAWPDPERRPSVVVVGTDLNPVAVRKATAGVYGPWSFRGVDPETLERCFERVPGGLRVGDRFRSLVRFAPMNLAAAGAAPPWGVGAADVVVCRNVVTYFDASAARRAVETIRGALAPWGCLLVSPSEAMLPVFEGLMPVVAPDATVFRVRGVPPPSPLVAAPASGAAAGAATRLGEVRHSARSVPVAGALASLARAPGAAGHGMGADRREAVQRFRQGLRAREEGDLARSIELLRSAIYVDPTFPPAHLALAGVLALCGATGRARKELDVAASLLEKLPRNSSVVEGEAEVTAGRMLELVAVQRGVLAEVGERA